MAEYPDRGRPSYMSNKIDGHEELDKGSLDCEINAETGSDGGGQVLACNDCGHSRPLDETEQAILDGKQAMLIRGGADE